LNCQIWSRQVTQRKIQSISKPNYCFDLRFKSFAFQIPSCAICVSGIHYAKCAPVLADESAQDPALFSKTTHNNLVWILHPGSQKFWGFGWQRYRRRLGSVTKKPCEIGRRIWNLGFEWKFWKKFPITWYLSKPNLHRSRLFKRISMYHRISSENVLTSRKDIFVTTQWSCINFTTNRRPSLFG
jgi:hypothetical protein